MADEPLLFGLADESISENDDKICGWSTNKIGGTPNWLLGPPTHYPTCSLCKRLLYLVCQIYCPLSDSLFHRVLYIFGCSNTSCFNQNQSWKVLRCQAKDSNFGHSKEISTNESNCRLEAGDWCEGADDWGDETGDILLGLEQCAGNLHLSENDQDEEKEEQIGNSSKSNPQNASSNSGFPHFAPFYISVTEAPNQRENSTQLTKHEKKLLSDYQKREGALIMDESGDMDVKGGTRELYERATVKHGDRAFHKFSKYLQVCPQQCLRYQWNGTYVSNITTNQSELLTKVPLCQHCGAVRVFELQLMPALVGKLERMKNSGVVHSMNNGEELYIRRNKESFSTDIENSTLDGPVPQQERRRKFLAAVNQMNDLAIEFGTVMVFSCSQSCWAEIGMTTDAIYLEEFCMVEADPDQKLFQ